MDQSMTVEQYCKDNDLEEEYQSLKVLRYHKWTSLANILDTELQTEITSFNEQQGRDLCPINKGDARELINKAKQLTGKTTSARSHDESLGVDTPQVAPSTGKRTSMGGSTCTVEVTKKTKSCNKATYQQYPSKYGTAAMMEKVFAAHSTRTFPGYGTFKNAAQASGQTVGAYYYAHPETGVHFIEFEDPSESNKWKGAYKCTYPGCTRTVTEFSPLAGLGCIQNVITHGEDKNHKKAMKELRDSLNLPSPGSGQPTQGGESNHEQPAGSACGQPTDMRESQTENDNDTLATDTEEANTPTARRVSMDSASAVVIKCKCGNPCRKEFRRHVECYVCDEEVCDYKVQVAGVDEAQTDL